MDGGEPMSVPTIPTTQIITFTPGAEPEFVLDHASLTSVFTPAADKHIELITIAGAARQGRSFLFNFILRYMQSMERDEDDFLGWDKPDDPLNGFTWGHGDERKTLGVWITSKPVLTRESADGKKVAVYLMDTQGILDEFSNAAHTRFILDLCLRVSTTFIFTSVHEFHEDKLLALGQALEPIAGLHCNRIYLVVRDWSQPDVHPIGETGGQMYKEKRLQIQGHHSQASKAAREVLQSQVGKIDCFLFPSPGPKIRNNGYNGNLAGLSPKFSGALEPFLLSIMTEDNLVSPSENKKTGTNYMALFETFKHGGINQLSAHEQPKMKPKEPEISNEDKIMNLYMSLLDDYQTNLKGLLEASPHKFLDPAALDDLNVQFMKVTGEKYTDCNLQASFGTLRKYQTLLNESLEGSYAEIKQTNEERRNVCLGKWEDAVSKATDSYREDIQGLFKSRLPSKAKERTTMDRISKDTREYFDTLVNVQVEDLYATYSQNLAKRFEEIFIEEKAAAAQRQRQKRLEQFDLCKTLVAERYDSEMQNLIQQSGAAVCSLGQMKSFHNTASKKLRSMEIDLPDDEDDGTDSYEVQLFAHLTARFDEILAQNNAKRDDFLEKKQEWLEPALDIYMKHLINWKQEEGSKSIERFEQAAEEAKEEAQAVLKSKTIDVRDDGLITQFYTELNATIEKFRIAEFHELEEMLKARQQQMDEAVSTYQRKMSLEMKKLQIPTPEAIQALHAAAAREVMAEIEPDINAEFKADLECALSVDQLAEFQRKAAGQLKARKHEAEHFLRKATEKYEVAFLAIDFKNCVSKQEFTKRHAEILEGVIKEFTESIGITEESFLQQYIDQLNTKAGRLYDQQFGLLDVKLEKDKILIQKQVTAASKAYEVRMKNHFKKNPFMRQDVFRLESDRMMAKLTGDFGSKLPGNGHNAVREALEALYVGFEERNTMNTPSENTAIGIDLGTTYSCVAVYHKGEVHVIPSGIGGNTVPSYVGFTPQGELIGEAAKNQAHENPVDTIFDAKRLIGRDFNDPIVQADMKLWPFKVVGKSEVGKPVIMAGGTQRDPELISAKVLKHLKNMAQTHLQLSKITKAIITVPAYFNDGQRQATMDAGDIAGLEVLQIINEPTAAAMAYYFQNEASEAAGSVKKNILVYDLGGGTFDVSVLEISGGDIVVKAVNGDTHLGGEDFDQKMVEFCVAQFKAKTGIDIRSQKQLAREADQVAAARQLRRLRNECEKRKKDLSEAQHTTIAVDEVYGHDLHVKMSRAEFEEMNRVKFDLTIEIVRKALLDAKLSANEIEEVVLVGGSTRIPKIQELLTVFFGGRPLYLKMNPDEAVARGAAILAAKVNGEAEQKLLKMNFKDVAPLSIGTELYDGKMSVIVPRNTPIPCKIVKDGYRTVANNQTCVDVRVYEGEDRIAKNNHFLGSFLLEGIPKAKAGSQTLAEGVEITKDGILHVTATLDSTGGSNDITIKTEKGRLSQEAIADLREMVAAE